MSRGDAARALRRLGFTVEPKRGKGSHIVLWSESKRKSITVPDHRELGRGTLRAILRQADTTIEEFTDALA